MMKITARQPVETTAVAVATRGKLLPPEPAALFGLFPTSNTGSRYFDDPALSVRSITVPNEALRLTFERMRVRVEDTGARHIEDLHVGETLSRAAALYPKGSFDRYGFNYDVIYRFDNVLPTREIIGAFIADDVVEDVSHFGWQFTVAKDKGKRRETYYCKVVSPLELQVLANVEFDRPLPDADTLEKELRVCQAESQEIISQLRLASL